MNFQTPAFLSKNAQWPAWFTVEIQRQLFTRFLEYCCFWNISEISQEVPRPDYCFNKISGLQLAVLLRKSPAQLFLVIMAQFFRTAIFKRTTYQLLLKNCILPRNLYFPEWTLCSKNNWNMLKSLSVPNIFICKPELSLLNSLALGKIFLIFSSFLYPFDHYQQGIFKYVSN